MYTSLNVNFDLECTSSCLSEEILSLLGKSQHRGNTGVTLLLPSNEVLETKFDLYCTDEG